MALTHLLATLLFAFVGPVAARPPPAVLGPDGPMWLGPLPPGHGGTVAVVDPRSGRLSVEERDAPGIVRDWDGESWTVRVGGERLGRPVTMDWQPPGDLDYAFDGGRLQAVDGGSGGRRRYFYDAQGRLAAILWADGARLRVRYDPQGRVREMGGPGPAIWRYEWQPSEADGLPPDLLVHETLGRSLSMRWHRGSAPGVEVLAVRDTLGREVRTRYRDDGGRKLLLGWQDPRGLETNVARADGDLVVTGAASGRWEISLDAQDRPTAVVGPAGHTWRWARDASGRVVTLVDPSGTAWHWERDAAGRVIEVRGGGRRLVLARDATGQVVAITDGMGATTRLERDAQGAVVKLVDAVGNVVRIGRDVGGGAVRVTGRAGGIWVITRDLLDRFAGVEDPTGRTVTIHHDLAGWIDRIEDSVFGTTRFDRTADGHLTRVTDPAGRVTGLVRDALGRLAELRLADGEVLDLKRDLAGDVIEVDYAGEVVKVSRDAAGRPLRAGEIVWRRDGAGRVVGLCAPGVEFVFQRDALGRLVGVFAQGWRLEVSRDASGLPISQVGSDGSRTVIRDADGRIVSVTELLPTGRRETVRVGRDPLGRVVRVVGPEGTWTWGRDAAGRVLIATGPRGLRLGVDRDPAGRPILVRFAGHYLLKRSWHGRMVHEVVDDLYGTVLVDRWVTVDALGRVVRVESGDEQRIWRTGPLGDPVAIERADGHAWSWTPDGIEGPQGEVVVFDRQGRAESIRLPAPGAWGLSGRSYTVFRDALGRMVRLSGERSAATLHWDSVGRLSEVVAGRRRWRILRNVLGRPVKVGDTDLRWLPDRPVAADGGWPGEGRGCASGSADLRATGGTTWLSGPDGPAVFGTAAGWLARLVLLGGEAPWQVSSAGAPVAIRSSPTGWSDARGPAALAGPGGAVELWPGGPLWCDGTLIDPGSGQRVDGRRDWPWAAHRDPRGPTGQPRWDPADWAPESRWSQPLAILGALGALRPVDEGPWTALPPQGDRAVPWLPASLDGDASPPIGPAPLSLPLTVDPVTTAVLLAVLPGGAPLSAERLLDAALAAEDPGEWLPPRLPVPGLAALRVPGER